MTTFGNRVKAVLTTTALSVAAAGFLAGCDLGEDQSVYCVDNDNNVVDDDFCDTDYHGSGVFFLYTGVFDHSYRSGQHLPTGGTRISAKDSAARANAGLPRSGKVSSGTRISGGIGSGKGGFSGGSRGGSAGG